jgi:ankyrin repeat protein
VQNSAIVQVAARQIQPGRKQNAEIIQAIRHLSEHGAEVDLFSAVAIGDLERVQSLLTQSPDLAAARSDDGYPALHLSVDLNHDNIVTALLKAGCDIDIRSDSKVGLRGGSPLHQSAIRGRNRISRLLIEAGADVNALSDLKTTPLHHAAKAARVRTARLLLERGARIDAVDENGKTPLELFRENCRNVPEMERIFGKYRSTAIK